VTISNLLAQGRVLLQLLRGWWPAQSQQQQKLAKPPSAGAAAVGSDGSDGGAAARTAGGGRADSSPLAAAHLAVEAMQPLWAVTLQQWAAAGLLPQLLALLDGSCTQQLQQRLVDRCVVCCRLPCALCVTRLARRAWLLQTPPCTCP
jgi:hypothetical protein